MYKWYVSVHVPCSTQQRPQHCPALSVDMGQALEAAFSTFAVCIMAVHTREKTAINLSSVLAVVCVGSCSPYLLACVCVNVIYLQQPRQR